MVLLRTVTFVIILWIAVDGEIGEECSCPEGEPGMAGIDGMDGIAGAQGPTGERGSPGEPGPAGDQGPPGYDGLNGMNGADGEDGAAGKSGKCRAKDCLPNRFSGCYDSEEYELTSMDKKRFVCPDSYVMTGVLFDDNEMFAIRCCNI